MAIQCEFIDFIIPITKIDFIYPGGFKKFKEDNLSGFTGRLKHDDYLFRDGAMSSMDIQNIAKKWEILGLKGFTEINGQKQWADFCVVEGIFGGPTLPCNWIEYDRANNIVNFKIQP